ncbi:hypothetical protein BpHYR1_038127 [Brachionus plicatilis]|uniref:Uncharacterized protein n=1 Tax=Brachionus plicatilis TaxID=10195 RepID=A0A3M7Q1D8_BRAPC|nr:hypothetical protein BpHYR1_038127 [Brachionus plicatilis]
MIKLMIFSIVLLCLFCLEQANGYNCYSCSSCSAGSFSRTRIYCPFGCYVQRASSTPYTIRYNQGCYDPRFSSYNNLANYYSCFTDYCNTISKLNGSNQIQENNKIV